MKILLAIDGSPCSEAAIAEVGRRPWPAGSEARLITVDSPMTGDTLRRPPGVFDAISRQLRAEAEKRLHDAVLALKRAAPGLCVTTVLREGWPKDEILEEADRWAADLIVVGSHGFGTVRRLFLGSVSLAVATNAKCCVEIVRSPVAPSNAPATT